MRGFFGVTMTSKKLNTEEKPNIVANYLPNIEAPNISKQQKDIAKEKLNELMKEESKLVKGKFQCFETPGATVKITIRKYPGPKQGGIPHFEKVMTDQNFYEVPLYVARHLNGTDVTAGAASNEVKINPNIGTCSYPIHGFKFQGNSLPPSQDGYGPDGQAGIPVPIVGVAKRVQRYGFQSMEFAAIA